jgi:hypothetical protein
MLEKTAKNRQWCCLSQRFFGRILQSGQIRTILRERRTIPCAQTRVPGTLCVQVDADCSHASSRNSQ